MALIAEVYTSGESSDDVAGQWLGRYREDGPEAVTELVNFVLRSAGCTIQVTRDDIDDVDNVEGRVADLQDEYQAVLSLYQCRLFGIVLILNSKTLPIILLSRRPRAAMLFGRPSRASLTV